VATRLRPGWSPTCTPARPAPRRTN